MSSLRLAGRRGVRPVAVGCALALAAAGSGREAAAPAQAVSELGVVTRREERAPSLPNPLRHVPDELLVRFRPGVAPARAAQSLSRVPLRFTRRMRSVDNLHHVKLAAGVALRQAVRVLQRDRSVLYVEPNFVIDAFAEPDDPSFASQWALRNVGQTGGTPGADIEALAAWDVTTGNRGVVVAVIDTGADYTHEDLGPNIWVNNTAECFGNGVDDDGNGYVDDCHGIDTMNGDSDPMDDNGHGSHVAGTIGAAGNSHVGVTGVNWNVTILPCKFLDESGRGSTAGAIACLDYVAVMRDRGLNVVATNNSWGGGLFSQALTDAIRAQQQRGILFVAAAGNSAADNDVVRTYPCATDLPGVICVAATDHQDLLAGFSNRGRGTVHLGAPGVDILGTTPANGYESFSGTSMAAPHVSGVVALLHAQDPARDWRAVKNLILAGGAPQASLDTTLSGRRLSAFGALGCSGARLVSRRKPTGAELVTGLAPVELSVLNIDCGDPAGPVTVTVNPTGDSVTLVDDGLLRDQVSSDGVYTATWTPTSGGTFDLHFPDGSVVTATVDPYLEPGFPVRAFTGPGTYHGGPAVHTLVGNIDADPALEVLATGLAAGPLYAWNADGTPVPGWPAVDAPGAAYAALGELAAGEPGLEVFSAHFGVRPDLVARSGTALPLPGWPQQSANYVATPPTLADVDGDGLDEVFGEEEDWRLHAYRATGEPLPGWPTNEFVGGQERHTPSVADLDGDGDLEIVTASGWTSGGVYLLAYHHDGSPVSGFPIRFEGDVDTFPVIGDVDGDRQLDIVVGGRAGAGRAVRVFSANGALERTMAAAGSYSYGTAPALADLDGDGVPEILVQTETAVNVWKGDGSVLPGWPVSTGAGNWLENAGPVVGDVDGDGEPDVVALALKSSGNVGDVLVFRADGSVLGPAFPKRLLGLGAGAVPAIADLDLDGRSEIIVSSDFWNGASGYYDKVWAWDLAGPGPYGAIEWGQFMGGARHLGLYGAEEVVAGLALVVAKAGGGEGTVTSDPAGIDCGTDCSERYALGTAVTLTAAPSAGSAFVSWEGACAGQGNPCTLTIAADETVTASFAPLFGLSVAAAGAGSGAVRSDPDGIDCGQDCFEAYVSGTTVTLTATPSAGSAFVSWEGACAGQGNPCTLAMTASRSVTAHFGLTSRLEVVLRGNGSGTVTSTPPGIECGSDCSEIYLRGTVVTLLAAPADGSRFVRWEGACRGRSAICSLTLASSASVAARFRRR